MEKVIQAADQFQNLIGGNEVFKKRTKKCGRSNCRNSRKPMVFLAQYSGHQELSQILRTQTDYLPYDQFDYDIPVGENGDCYDRWDVRVKEMVESAKNSFTSNRLNAIWSATS